MPSHTLRFSVLLAGTALAAVFAMSGARADGGNGGNGGFNNSPGGAGGVGYSGAPGGDATNNPFEPFGGGGGGAAGGGNGGDGVSGVGGTTPGQAGGSDVGNGYGAGGGAGGANGVTAGSLANTTPVTAQSGGAGGDAGGYGSGGGGGGGGYGAVISGTIADNTSTITAGNGGKGGDTFAAGYRGNGGSGGDGGVGVQFTGTGATFTNSGNVTGGTGGVAGLGSSGGVDGAAGAGGAGVVGADLTIINSGAIVGGSSGAGIQANAVTFTSGSNIFELRAGGSATGNVVGTGSDTFRLGGSTNATFDGTTLGPAAQYQGFGTFEKAGTSTWTFTGASTFVGSTIVDAGTLVMNGSLPIGTSQNPGGVQINGGTLSGTGSIPFTFIGTGTLAPGPTGSTTGTLTIYDQLVMCNCTTYAVKITPISNDSVNVIGGLNATGTADLGGATVRATFLAGSYVSKQYTILTTDGGRTGTFGALTTVNLPANATATLSYTTNDVLLNLVLAFAGPNFPGGLNGNQQNVANTLSAYFNAAGGIPAAFANLDGNGLSQTAGEPGADVAQGAIDAANQFLKVLTDPSFAGRSGNAGGGGATGYASEADAFAYAGRPARTRDAYAAVTPRDRVAAVSFDQRWSVWGAAYGGTSTTSGDAVAGSHATTSRVYGAMTGADFRVSPDGVIGFALGGGGTSFGVDSALGGGRSDLFQAGLFGTQRFGAGYFTGAAAYGWQDVTTQRTVTAAGSDRLEARFQSNTLSARTEGGYRIATPVMGVTPYGAAQVTSVFLPSYGESAVSGASTFALGYGSQDVTAVRTEAGLRLDRSFLLADALLTLRGRAAWAHDYNQNRAATATFQSLPGANFVVGGASPSPDAALVTAGAEVKWANGFAMLASFEGEFSDNTTSYGGKGSVRYSW